MDSLTKDERILLQLLDEKSDIELPAEEDPDVAFEAAESEG